MNTEDIELFHSIVESGSLASASNNLDMPKSTLSRKLSSLEHSVGTKLFHRHGRSIKLTMAGEHFYERSKQLLSDLGQTLLEITDDKAELKGNLKILIAPGPKHNVLFSKVMNFMELHPNVRVELVTRVDATDLIKEQVDVAIMGKHMFTNTDVVAKHLISEAMRYYVTPEYIDKFGEPKVFSDLSHHSVALFRYTHVDQSRRAMLPNGEWQTVKNQFMTNDVNALTEAVKTSRYIAMLPERTHEDLVAQGKLIPLFREHPSILMEVFLVHPSRRYISVVAQKFVDYLYSFAKPDKSPIC